MSTITPPPPSPPSPPCPPPRRPEPCQFAWPASLPEDTPGGEALLSAAAAPVASNAIKAAIAKDLPILGFFRESVSFATVLPIPSNLSSHALKCETHCYSPIGFHG
jgi:hypothetical protein